MSKEMLNPELGPTEQSADRLNLGQWLRRKLKEEHLSQQKFAQNLGVSQSYVSQVMSGHRRAHPLFVERTLSVLPASDEEKARLTEMAWGLESRTQGKSGSLDLAPLLPVTLSPNLDPIVRTIGEEYNRTVDAYSRYEAAFLNYRAQLGRLGQALGGIMGSRLIENSNETPATDPRNLSREEL